VTKTIRDKTDTALHAWKVIQMLTGFSALLLAAWVQFLGPGIRSALQEFLGVSEISQRLAWVEEFMPAPTVVEWVEGASRQPHPCYPGETCPFILTGSRTPYGEACGLPVSITPFLRLQDGRLYQSEFPGFKGVELDRVQTSFEVPLDVPHFIPVGQHQFRVRVVYPTCPGRNEPIPRWTPWFDLKLDYPHKAP
jgi:hypothetical protein